MSVSETTTKTAAGRSGSAEKGIVCVIDLGKHSKKRIRRLRRGQGRLMERVEDAVTALHDDGVLTGNAQTVVVVVRQEPSGMFGS
jgi:hypothetical protein